MWELHIYVCFWGHSKSLIKEGVENGAEFSPFYPWIEFCDALPLLVLFVFTALHIFPCGEEVEVSD